MTGRTTGAKSSTISRWTLHALFFDREQLEEIHIFLAHDINQETNNQQNEEIEREDKVADYLMTSTSL